MGRQLTGLLANVIGYYIIGLPVGALLAFYVGWRVAGLWWGLIIGLVVVSAGYIVYLAVLVDWNKEVELAAKRIQEQEDDVNLLQEKEQEASEVVLEDIMAGPTIAQNQVIDEEK
jgi:MATE family multidrug resistance protein